MTEPAIEQETKKQFTEEELLTFAKRPDLLRYIRLDLDKFIAGEEANKLTLFLICTSKIQRQPLGAIITGESAAGKNHLVRNVTQYFVPRVLRFSRVTPASLERRQVNMDNMILFIEELGGLQAQPALRIMLSEGGLRLLTSSFEGGGVDELITEGTPVFLTTTTNYQVEKQLQTRILFVSIDETEAQTRKIIKFKAKDAEFQNSQIREPDPLIVQFLNSDILQPHNVAIPYADDLSEIFPIKSLAARRDWDKMITLVRMSAILHQLQRRRVQNPDYKMDYFILADKIDLDYAIDIAGTTLEQTLAGIQKRTSEALEIFKTKIKMTSTDLAKELKLSTERARYIANALVNAGYVDKDTSEKIHVFTYRKTPQFKFTTMKDIFDKWHEGRVQQWLQENHLVIKEEVPEPQYINPFSPFASEASKTKLCEHRSKKNGSFVGETKLDNASVPTGKLC